LKGKTLTKNISSIQTGLIDEPGTVDRFGIDSEKVKELADSISEIGLLQPIVVRKAGDRFEIIAGHRRYLAHNLLGKTHINAIVNTMSDDEAAIARATENLARVDLTPMEEGAIYNNLIEKHGMSVNQVGKKMGIKGHTVKRRLDLLRMPPCLQDAIHAKHISMTVAEELWAIRDQTDLEYYLHFAIESGCTRVTARGWAKDWKDLKRRENDPDVEGGFSHSPMEPRPVFVTCDTCLGPMEIGKESVLRVCPKCWQLITENLKEQ